MDSFSSSLLVVETHPVQYRVPVYRALQATWGVKVHMLYGSDFSIAGYFDKNFHTKCTWDVDLLSGIDRSEFLERSAEGGATSMDEISAKGIGRAIRKSDTDAVLVTGYSPLFHLYGFRHVLGLKRPILFRAETTKSHGGDSIKRSVRNSLLRRLYSRCDRILPIGKWSYEHYQDLNVAPEKLIFSPYCVDTEPFRWDEPSRTELREVTRAQLGVAADRILIIFSGKIYEHKRPRMLLEAIRLLPEKWRERVELLFLGSGPDMESVLAEAAREPSIRATCTGFQGQSQLSPYYHASDLLVLPSKSETWGLVVNESLHHGVPCVVTDTVGSGPDLVHSGVTGEIAAGTAASLAEAMMRAFPLIGKPEVRDQCRLAVGKYTVSRAAEGMYRAVQETTQTAVATQPHIAVKPSRAS